MSTKVGLALSLDPDTVKENINAAYLNVVNASKKKTNKSCFQYLLKDRI